jgi:hypothetical protein
VKHDITESLDSSAPILKTPVLHKIYEEEPPPLSKNQSDLGNWSNCQETFSKQRRQVSKDKFYTELNVDDTQEDLSQPVHIRKVIKSKVNGEWRNVNSNKDVIIKCVVQPPEYRKEQQKTTLQHSMSSYYKKKRKSSLNDCTLEEEMLN